MSPSSSFWFPLFGFGSVVVIGLVLIIWALVYARATGGQSMDRPNWGTQFYAYSICIIAVITFLFSLSGLVSSAFDAAQPLRARGTFGSAILTSFEAYKATYNRDERMFGRSAPAPAAPSDAELQRQYEALRQDRIDGAKFQFIRDLVSDTLLIALALALFVVHWRLATRAGRTAGGAA